MGWSKSGEVICVALQSTAPNWPELHHRDLLIPCFRRSAVSSGPPGGQGVAGSNPVVPTARWAVSSRRGTAHCRIYVRKRRSCRSTAIRDVDHLLILL